MAAPKVPYGFDPGTQTFPYGKQITIKQPKDTAAEEAADRAARSRGVMADAFEAGEALGEEAGNQVLLRRAGQDAETFGKSAGERAVGEYAARQIRIATNPFVGPSDFRDQGPPAPEAVKKRKAAAPPSTTTKTVTQLDPRPPKSNKPFEIPQNGPRLVQVNEWRDRLLRASFRGIPFEVETYSMSIGRRTAVYEYPHRDLPSAQDFGLATRDVTFSAYVLGDDYDLQRNNLIQALEFPGPGELVHPYYGRVKVNVTSAKVSETATEYRMAKFELSFVAVDQVTTSPVVATNTVMASDVAKEKAVAAAYDRLTVIDEELADVVTPAYDAFKTAMETTLNTVFQANAVAAGLVFSAEGAIADVQKSIEEFIGGLKSLQQIVDYVLNGGPFMDLLASGRQVEAMQSFNEFIQSEMLSQCVDIILESDWDSYEELYRTTGEVVAAISALEADTDNPETYDAMAALRIQLMQMVWDLGRVLPHEMTLEFVGAIPAVVISYSMYETPTRDTEIVQRNLVVNPTFVTSTIQVLSA